MQNAVFGVDVEASTETSVISKFFRKNVRKLRYFSELSQIAKCTNISTMVSYSPISTMVSYSPQKSNGKYLSPTHIYAGIEGYCAQNFVGLSAITRKRQSPPDIRAAGACGDQKA